MSNTALAVAVPVPMLNDDDPGPSLYLTTLVELFMGDQSPAQALCSLLAMCWFWQPSCEGGEKDLLLVSVVLRLGRLLKDKLACLAENVSDCLSCQTDAKGDKQPVIMGCGRLT